MQKVVEAAELGGDGVVAAGLVADGVWTARVVRTSHQAVVGPLALGASDGVDGRHVQRVEPHTGDGGYARLSLAEGCAACGVGALRARKDLVPGREPGCLAIDDQLELASIARGVRAIRPAVHDVAE